MKLLDNKWARATYLTVSPRQTPRVDTDILTKRSSALQDFYTTDQRKLSELVLTYARQILEQMDSERGKAIAAYRAGYSADHRRAIEGSLFNGNLKGVAATNALELGIDVGALDVTLHLGEWLCSLFHTLFSLLASSFALSLTLSDFFRTFSFMGSSFLGCRFSRDGLILVAAGR